MNKALKSSVVLLSGVALQRLANFGLIGVLAVSLNPADFARYGLFASVLSIVPVIATLGAQFAPGRLIFDYPSPESQLEYLRTTVRKTLLFGGAAIAAVGLLAQLLRTSQLEPALFEDQFILFASLSSFALILVEFGRVLLRVRGSVYKYVGLSLLQHLGAFIVIFAASRSRSLDAHLLFGLFTFIYAITAVGATLVLMPALKLAKDLPDAYLKSLRYSTPLAVHSLGAWLIGHSGRWIGVTELGISKMAPYFLLLQSVQVIQMLNGTLLDARLPDIGAKLSASDYMGVKAIIARTLVISAAIMTLVYLLGAALLFGTSLTLPENFRLTPPLLAGAWIVCLLETIYVKGTQEISLFKRTELQVVATLISGVVTVVATLFFLRIWPRIESLIVAYIVGATVQAILTNTIAWRLGLSHSGSDRGARQTAR